MTTSSIHELMRTEHYHPSLNSAVFDGPLRIYFAQSQESLALNFYFQLQKVFDRFLGEARDSSPSWYFVVLMYPQKELMALHQGVQYKVLNFGQDRVILTHGQMDQQDQDQLVADLSQLIEQSCFLLQAQPEAVM